jgi:transcriptional regulator with XRE-family HTH domain
MSIILNSSHRVAEGIALRSREKRLNLNLSQKSLSERSGVSYGTLKKFEQTGKISLESLLKLALALNQLEGFEKIFSEKLEEHPISMDELLKDNTRKRGRK